MSKTCIFKLNRDSRGYNTEYISYSYTTKNAYVNTFVDMLLVLIFKLTESKLEEYHDDTENTKNKCDMPKIKDGELYKQLYSSR